MTEDDRRVARHRATSWAGLLTRLGGFAFRALPYPLAFAYHLSTIHGPELPASVSLTPFVCMMYSAHISTLITGHYAI